MLGAPWAIFKSACLLLTLLLTGSKDAQDMAASGISRSINYIFRLMGRREYVRDIKKRDVSIKLATEVVGKVYVPIAAIVMILSLPSSNSEFARFQDDIKSGFFWILLSSEICFIPTIYKESFSNITRHVDGAPNISKLMPIMIMLGAVMLVGRDVVYAMSGHVLHIGGALRVLAEIAILVIFSRAIYLIWLVIFSFIVFMAGTVGRYNQMIFPTSYVLCFSILFYGFPELLDSAGMCTLILCSSLGSLLMSILMLGVISDGFLMRLFLKAE